MKSCSGLPFKLNSKPFSFRSNTSKIPFMTLWKTIICMTKIITILMLSISKLNFLTILFRLLYYHVYRFQNILFHQIDCAFGLTCMSLPSRSSEDSRDTSSTVSGATQTTISSTLIRHTAISKHVAQIFRVRASRIRNSVRETRCWICRIDK